MVTGEPRATRLRERGSIAAKPPRVVGKTTNIQRLAAAASAPADELSALRIYNSIPEHHHGVIPVDGDGAAPLLRKGEVAVYEAYEPHIHGLIDGGLYVIEYQTPRGGATREMFARWFAEYGARLRIDRRIVRITKSTHKPDGWYATSIEGAKSILGIRGIVFSDGPYEEIHLADKLIGVVTGIYRGPAA